MPKKDPRITKRRVTMSGVANGIPVTITDFVRPDHLDAYVADARTKWERVEVSEEPDAGPAGYEGATFVPAHLDLPDAGTLYPAEEK